jgi:hypothetical protein
MSHPALQPWRVLILDPSRDDPIWLVATIVTPADVRPASPQHGGSSTPKDAYALDEVTAAWAAAATGLERPSFTLMRGALCWRADEGERQ